jgi:translation initiation factor 4E
MKKGILPVWEDPENEGGGFWVLRFPRDKIEAVWRDLCLAAIGENFYSVLRPGDAINGVTVSIRRNDVVVQVWNKLAEEEPEQKRVITHVINSVLKEYQIGDYWYKPCQGHDSYDSNFAPKETSAKAASGSNSFRPSNRRK